MKITIVYSQHGAVGLRYTPARSGVLAHLENDRRFMMRVMFMKNTKAWAIQVTP